MTPQEVRIERLEAEFDRLKLSLSGRLDRLEKLLPAAPQRQTWWARFFGWMGAELPKFLTAAVLLIIGFGIKDSVDLSIKQRQLDLSYAKEMQELVQKMSEKSAEMTQIESTAVVLASYGEAALPPLLNELRYGGLRANGAEAGIRALALMHPAAVCEVLPSVLTSRAWRFNWESQVKVVRILGEGNCSAAIRALKNYRQAVAAAAQGDGTEFEKVVRELPKAPADDYPRILDTVDKSLHMLERR